MDESAGGPSGGWRSRAKGQSVTEHVKLGRVFMEIRPHWRGVLGPHLCPRDYIFLLNLFFTLSMGVFCLYVKSARKRVSSRTEVADILSCHMDAGN